MLVSEYVPTAMNSMAASTQRGWSTYAREIVERWGSRELGEVRKTDIETAARQIQERAKRRAVSLEGMGAKAGFISCCRAIWARAVDDEHCTSNPALRVEMPPRKRTASNRRALNNDELARVQGILAASSDPDLALLAFRIFLETGARRNELLGLKTSRLEETVHGCTLTLREGTKRDSVRSLPITDVLATGIRDHAVARISPNWAEQKEPLLRNKRGQAITHRWLERNAALVRQKEPALGSTTEIYFTWHLLRHTAGTLIERAGGFAAAQHFLGHAPTGGSATAVTLSYTKPTQDYLRRCLEVIWEPQKAQARRVRENRQAVVRAYLESEPDESGADDAHF